MIFYITTPKALVPILKTTTKSDHVKGTSYLLISPPLVGIGASCHPLEFVKLLLHIDEIAKKLNNSLKSKGESVSNFKVPIKYKYGTISGLYVKLCSPTIADLLASH